MKHGVLLGSMLLLALPAVAQDAEAPFQEALDRLLRHGYIEAELTERYLLETLEQDPEHLEAMWYLIRLRLPARSASATSRAEELFEIAPFFDHFSQLARRDNEMALLHYASAVYAQHYDAYQRALSEIDRAVSLEPKSARYLMEKGALLVDYGDRSGQDSKIEEGISVLLAAKELSRTHPHPFLLPQHYDWELAWAYSQLQERPDREVVKYYLSFLEQAAESQIYAYAWNNLSIALRNLRQCDRAKQAAEYAQEISNFGRAKSSRQNAEYCLEMQKMGLMKSSPDQGPDLAALFARRKN